MIDAMQPCTYTRSGGAGNKILQVINGDSDIYVYPKAGMGTCDVCGPEALVRAQFGKVTDFEQKPFTYNH